MINAETHSSQVKLETWIFFRWLCWNQRKKKGKYIIHAWLTKTVLKINHRGHKPRCSDWNTDKDGEFVFGPLCPDKKYEIQVFVNRVKHVKVCAKTFRDEKCLKGVKLDKCDHNLTHCDRPHKDYDCDKHYEDKDCKVKESIYDECLYEDCCKEEDKKDDKNDEKKDDKKDFKYNKYYK